MAFAERLAYARKQKKIKQADLGKMVGTSGDIIGKYERGENTPSIEVAAKIADALGVTLDYLVKEGEYEQIDKTTLKRLKDIERLDPNTKTKIFDIIDTYLRDFKTRQAYGA
jgi:transcriptional regulator with XRE-family HTH domain